MIRCAVIVPCFEEEAALHSTHRVLTDMMGRLIDNGDVSEDSFILYVDDGSRDITWQLITSFTKNGGVRTDDERRVHVEGIRLSRNFGHQYALLAGMEYAAGKCDACVTIDADLQDDPTVIPEMIGAYKRGAEVVYGVRNRRENDGWFKKHSAHAYYRLLKILGVDCVYDHADYRLLGSRALEALLEYRERNVFLRGIVPQLGFCQEKVYYQRGERKEGKSKYPVGKMLEFAADGVTSFSVTPVRMLFWLGLIFMATALGVGIYVFIRYFNGETIEGWTSLILSIWFCTGVLLFGMGILGEYVGKIYMEVKKRPRYKISETTEA